MTDLYYSEKKKNILVEGFNVAGMYCVENPEVGNTKILFTPSSQNVSSAPVCIVTEGYRGDGIHGQNNKIATEILVASGFSVMQMNYAGFDHYGETVAADKADCGTLKTNIEDLKNALGFVGSDRKKVVLANSYSVNVAFGALKSQDTQIDHIIAAAPFPNLVQIQMLSQLENSNNNPIIAMAKSQLENRGFINYPHNGCTIKITQKFLSEVQEHPERYDLFSDALKSVEQKPTLSFVYSDQDNVVPKGLVHQFANHAKDCGFDVTAEEVLSDPCHAPTEKFFDRFKAHVQDLALSLGA